MVEKQRETDQHHEMEGEGGGIPPSGPNGQKAKCWAKATPGRAKHRPQGQQAKMAKGQVLLQVRPLSNVRGSPSLPLPAVSSFLSPVWEVLPILPPSNQSTCLTNNVMRRLGWGWVRINNVHKVQCLPSKMGHILRSNKLNKKSYMLAEKSVCLGKNTNCSSSSHGYYTRRQTMLKFLHEPCFLPVPRLGLGKAERGRVGIIILKQWLGIHSNATQVSQARCHMSCCCSRAVSPEKTAQVFVPPCLRLNSTQQTGIGTLGMVVLPFSLSVWDIKEQHTYYRNA